MPRNPGRPRPVRPVRPARRVPTGAAVAGRVAAPAPQLPGPAKPAVVDPPPLLLLPLRLEYRVFDKKRILVRWYPEEDFVERGTAPPIDAELAALATFDSATTGHDWFDTTTAAVVAAWQHLALQTGAARAVHLLRTRGGGGRVDWEDRMGRIALAPHRVAVFALDRAGRCLPLGTGADIRDVRYTPAVLRSDSWMVDFDSAVAAGMALRIEDAEKVATALEASWLIAVGLHRGDAAPALALLFEDWLAAGAVEVLPQDAPTNGAGAADVLTFLGDATHLERGRLGSGVVEACDLLAEALGVSTATLAKVVRAGDLGFEDARAMLRVVGPALLDTAVDLVPVLVGVSEDDLIDFFAACINARGVLPAIRVGKNPYGILPVTDVSRLARLAEDSDTEHRIDAFLARYSAIFRRLQAPRSDQLTPVIQPGDPRSPEKLETILQQYPVSRRIDVADTGSTDFDALACPYVSSRFGLPVLTKPAEYLPALRTRALGELPDPTGSDASTPLLYRLARLSLERAIVLVAEAGDTGRGRLSMQEPLTGAAKATATRRVATVKEQPLGALAGAWQSTTLGSSLTDAIRARSKTLHAGLLHLEKVAQRPDGNAQLRTLLLETIDLFQHRIDAWAAGLAHRRVAARRRAGVDGLRAGYFGLLSKLRTESATGANDGYIHAPALDQAVTAAVLRSAHLRFRGEGAFDLNLSSTRVRQAMEILELVKKGVSLQEILGLRGERWLHDRTRDADIFRLRDQYPLTNPASESAVVVRLFDGVAFLAATVPPEWPLETRNALVGLRARLGDDLDAFSDLVVCEAVHQRTHGQVETANAWIQVLSGAPAPGDPTFVRTMRQGHGSSHRVALVFEPAMARDGATPRELAEPTLAAVARRYLAGLNASIATLIVSGAAEPVRFRVTADLGMTALDVLIGGESELRVCARAHLIARWLVDESLQERLGRLPDNGVEAYVTRDRSIRLDLGAGAGSLAELLAMAADLRRLVQRGRSLEPSDLNGAASPRFPLVEADEQLLWQETLTTFRARAAALAARAASDAAMLRASARVTLTRARNYQRLVDAAAATAALGAAAAALEQARVALEAALAAASRFCEPTALRARSALDFAAAPDAIEGELRALAKRLEDKAAALLTLHSTTATPATALADVRRNVREVGAALAATVDGDALPILPCFGRSDATTARVRGATRISNTLGDWAAVRENVARARRVAIKLPDFSAFRVLPEATGADEKLDNRPESIAPTSRFFGVFLARRGAFPGATAFAGIVADEWSERRPSRTQITGVAVNHDSPQSEPSHCLLLCEPPAGGGEWDEAKAAAMVHETIEWMKVRALPTRHRLVPGALLPHANEVPMRLEQGRWERRIPTRDLSTRLDDGRDGLLVVAEGERNLGVEATGLNEVASFLDPDG